MIIVQMKYYNMILKRIRKNISIVLNDKIDKCEYLMGEEILTSDHRRVIEQGRFTYSFF